LKLVAQADPNDASIRYLLSGAYKKVGKLEAAEAELKAFQDLRAKQDRDRREYLQQQPHWRLYICPSFPRRTPCFLRQGVEEKTPS
jgi:hypothetical protein